MDCSGRGTIQDILEELHSSEAQHRLVSRTFDKLKDRRDERRWWLVFLVQKLRDARNILLGTCANRLRYSGEGMTAWLLLLELFPLHALLLEWHLK